MILNKIEDPRDNLSKATRYQVWKFAKANGIDFPEGTPADIVRAELRRRGLRNIAVNRPELGAQNSGEAGAAVVPPSNGKEVDALADITAQWERDRQRDLASGKTKRPDRGNQMTELRLKARELHIKVDRRDNVKTLRAKIEAKSGKDAAQQLQ